MPIGEGRIYPPPSMTKENAASLNAEAAGAVVGISNRNEASAASTPPAAAGSSVPADYYDDVEFGELDDDAVNANEYAELWLIRAPTAVSIFRHDWASAAYDIYALEPPLPAVNDENGNNDRCESVQEGSTAATAHVGVGVSAEELGSLSVLLPCKRKGGKRHLGACSHPPS
ncbi:hypothetical protein BGW80DRAFT_1255783 [Lactifluus volemus]|nr:hypothetical protein BGW80DRAFT_1255783 [Lactifluus volemus]